LSNFFLAFVFLPLFCDDVSGSDGSALDIKFYYGKRAFDLKKAREEFRLRKVTNTIFEI
jgi:hypothetical protein